MKKLILGFAALAAAELFAIQGSVVTETETVSGFKIGPVTQKLYDTLTGIQWGRVEDTFNWIEPVC